MIDAAANLANYILTIDNVREVNLSGTADLVYWRAQLQREDLFPYAKNGFAELQISGFASQLCARRAMSQRA